MSMQGIALNPVSNPSPEEFAQQLGILQSGLAELELSSSTWLTEIRNLTTAASVTATQRRLIVHMGELQQCIRRSKSLATSLQSLSDVLSQVQHLTSENNLLKQEVEDKTKALTTIQKHHLVPIRLNIQERADLDMFRAQENQLQAIQLSAEERQELETLQTQQNFLESIRLSAGEHRELVQLRGLRQQFEQQQDLTTQIGAIHTAVTQPHGMLAQIGTAVGNNKDQVLAGIQGSLTGIQTRINDTSANNQDAIARAQQSLTGIHDLLNGAVGGDQSTLVAGQQHLTDTVDDVQRTIEEIVDAVGDDRVDFATVLASVRDIQTTINDGVDVNQRPLQTFVPRMLRSIENMMRAMSPHERRISSERTRKAAKVNAEVEHTSLTSTSETPSSPAGHHDSSGRPLTRSTSRGRFKAVATRARNTMDALLHPSRSTVTLAPMPEEEDVSTEAPSSHTSVSPRHVGWVAQAADFNPVGMPFQPAYPQTGLPSQPGLTQTGVSTQTGFPTYTSLPAHTRSQSQPEQIPFETRPPLPTNQNLAVWNRPPTGGPSLRSPQSTPALLTHRPYAASSQAGPAHSQMYPFTINYHQRVSPSRITVSVEVDSNAQLLRHPNDILNANSIAVGDGSENVDGYQPFATNLGADVVHRFISDLTGLLCQMPESTYARLSQPVAKTMCMYKKAAKGNAQTEDFHACTLCVGHNRICLKKIKYSGGFVMFIAPLKDSHFRLSDLGAWIPNPSAPMRLPGTKR